MCAMQRKPGRLTALVFLLAIFVQPVYASSVLLLPTGDTNNLQVDDVVLLDVDIDFSAAGGTLGGGFDIFWDNTALDFVGLTSAGVGDPAFGRDPDVFDGLLESWGVGDFSGINSEFVGTVQFKVLPSMGLSTLVSVGPTSGIAGPWVSAADNVSLIDPDYNFVELTRAIPPVPLPAAVWMFGTALVGLFGFRNRKKLLPG